MALFRDMNAVWNDWVDPQNPPCPRLRTGRSGAPRGAGRNHGDRGEVIIAHPLAMRERVAEQQQTPTKRRAGGFARSFFFNDHSR